MCKNRTVGPCQKGEPMPGGRPADAWGRPGGSLLVRFSIPGILGIHIGIVAKGKIARGKIARGKIAKGKIAKGKIAKCQITKGTIAKGKTQRKP